jgi:cbb3-type cytochrome oxidase maturation protein
MNSLVFLIPLSIVLLLGAGLALFWAVDHGQFDDLETPGLLPLFDVDDPAPAAAPDDARATSVDGQGNASP